ncbi:MAG TPA: hypothetical protein VGY76_00470 [Solirubrobacteraceae bacterium]|nr:hypothetical protein [Solirubrobacteraceae bacterium]
MDRGLDEFIAATPQPQRTGLQLVFALARRPRGAALLSRFPPLAQVGRALVGMSRYEDPVVARALGWDAEAVVARGRALRRTEGRP